MCVYPVVDYSWLTGSVTHQGSSVIPPGMAEGTLAPTMGWRQVSPCPLLISPAENLGGRGFLGVKRVLIPPNNCVVLELCSISSVSSPHSTEVINQSECTQNPEWKVLSFLTVAL